MNLVVARAMIDVFVRILSFHASARRVRRTTVGYQRTKKIVATPCGA
jgi:hypothetical protein